MAFDLGFKYEALFDPTFRLLKTLCTYPSGQISSSTGKFRATNAPTDVTRLNPSAKNEFSSKFRRFRDSIDLKICLGIQN